MVCFLAISSSSLVNFDCHAVIHNRKYDSAFILFAFITSKSNLNMEPEFRPLSKAFIASTDIFLSDFLFGVLELTSSCHHVSKLPFCLLERNKTSLLRERNLILLVKICLYDGTVNLPDQKVDDPCGSWNRTKSKFGDLRWKLVTV